VQRREGEVRKKVNQCLWKGGEDEKDGKKTDNEGR
jgi:hypothetical protein